MPTPRREIITPTDHSPHEVETRAELDGHLSRGTLAGVSVQGLSLASVNLTGVEVSGALFIGCALTMVQTVDLVQRGAVVVPKLAGLPYPTEPSRLYTAGDLTAGFAGGGFDGMYDSVVYRHYVKHGGAMPHLREALAQRIHDHGIDNALAESVREWTDRNGPRSIVGIMGGHAEKRGSAGYRDAAALARLLAAADRLVLTGGGPGVMEAANLGAYTCGRGQADLDGAIDELAAAPDFTDHDAYTRVGLDVRARYAADPDVTWARRGGLSIPTWFYGHEPANVFAARIGKLFSNSVREELILRLSRGGIVFAPGRAGTVQEVFQAATMTFYAVAGDSGPFVFLGRKFWTEDLPVRDLLAPLLASAPGGDVAGLIHLTDDVDEAAALLIKS